MRILICDDDALFAEQLKKYIKRYFEQQGHSCPKLLCFSDGASLLNDNGEKDIVFLDIEMPSMNGIYIGDELQKKNKNTLIFIVSSYSEYLDEAMRFHAFRYLSKPLDKQRLFRNLKDAVDTYHTITCKIAVETKDGVFTLPASSIIAVEALERKIIVHTTWQDFHSIHNIQYWYNLLPKNIFFQTHRSYIVNFEHVTNFNHSLVYLDNQLNAYLTRRRYTAFKEAYLLYLDTVR